MDVGLDNFRTYYNTIDVEILRSYHADIRPYVVIDYDGALFNYLVKDLCNKKNVDWQREGF